MTARRVVVMGFGVTGRAVSRALASRGDQVLIFDDATESGAADVPAGVVVEATPRGSDLDRRLAGYDLVVPSPGVPVSHPIYAAAARNGIEVVAEIELAAQMLGQQAVPKILAVTGTNGKTTVTTLVTDMLVASGLAAVAAGNIGVPMIEAVTSGREVVVVEVSSFQLQYTDAFRPAVSCWLNLAPDHLDWHPDLDHYGAAKARIWANQGAGDAAVINFDDPAVTAAAAGIPGGVQRIGFSLGGSGDYTVEGGSLIGPGRTELLPVHELPRTLPHDLANCLAAAAVALAGGASWDGCRSALTRAVLLPHRVSLVAEHGGVSWFDDSKATTPASVLAAVAGFPSVVLIAGGRNKGLDLRVLAGTVPPVRAVVAIGDAATEVRDAFVGLVPVSIADTMVGAVAAAARLARPGDAVLLSPGCASFDWYASYGARGDDFVSIVKSRLVKGDSCADH